jgi:aminoglycoside 6'-N-acetyltransferase
MSQISDNIRIELWPVDVTHHRALLAGWLAKPHVTRWWGDVAAVLQQVETTPADQHALIGAGRQPVGYLRWQPVVRADLEAAGLHEIPDDALDADIFIGETRWLGKGIGPQALRLLRQQLASKGGYSILGLCTSVQNDSAIRAFAKAGFVCLRQYDDPDYGRCWVMTADLTS